MALIAGGMGLLWPSTAHLAALLSGLMIASWIFIVHLPQEVAGVGNGIAIFEAPAIAGILFVIAGYLYQQKHESQRGSSSERSSGQGVAPRDTSSRTCPASSLSGTRA